MSQPEPPGHECRAAVARAVGARIAHYRSDPVFANVTDASLAERVTGQLVPPAAGRDGWWRVGHILDAIEDTEYDVWYRPRGLGLTRRERVHLANRQPTFSRYANDGQHGWVDSVTGEPVRLTTIRRMLGVQELDQSSPSGASSA